MKFKDCLVYLENDNQLPDNAPNVWRVFGSYGGIFSNLKDAKRCAREVSTYEEENYEASVYRQNDGCYYIDYKNGRLVRDGWTINKG